ncbi:LysR family transcriptional regulator [Luteococcus sp. OSA5]|uniref:LysR substrate-binding domain-containing protein n=1 Tax=Luteococcus sp. OSA5 TaxID=3401630 RepID=UPI003B430300
MDLISLGYFRELAGDLNMTRTAGRLFLSQQTLSNHIRRLEDDFGTALLHRKPSLALTDAGVAVLAFAESVGRQEMNLRDQLEEVGDGQRGHLRLGCAPVRGNELLPQVVPRFVEARPHVQVTFKAGISSVITAMVLRGELDLGIVLGTQFDPELAQEWLYREQVVVCVPEQLLQRHCSPAEIRALKGRAGDGVGLADLGRLPFSVMTNQLGQRMAGAFARAGITPDIRFTGTATAETIPLAMAGMAACYCTQISLLRLRGQLDGINVFPLLDDGKPIFQEIHLIRHRERVMPGYAEAFVDGLKAVAADLQELHPFHVVE